MTEQEAIAARKQALIKKHQAEMLAAEDEARKSFRAVKSRITLLEDIRTAQIDAINTTINREIDAIKAAAGLSESAVVTDRQGGEDIPAPQID